MAPSTTELTDALSHILRRRILVAYLEGEFERASPAEIAGAWGERVAQVAYHLKTLARCNVLSPVDGEDAGRGHRYGFAPGVDPEWLWLLLAVSAELNPRRP
jgi:hypothetical protein